MLFSDLMLRLALGVMFIGLPNSCTGHILHLHLNDKKYSSIYYNGFAV